MDMGSKILKIETVATRVPEGEKGASDVVYLLFLLLIVFIILFTLDQPIALIYREVAGKLTDAMNVGK